MMKDWFNSLLLHLRLPLAQTHHPEWPKPLAANLTFSKEGLFPVEETDFLIIL